MPIIKSFKHLLNNISKQPSQTAEFKLINTVYNLTSDPSRIQVLYSDNNMRRGELSRRILAFVGDSNSWVAQNDEKAKVKRQIYKKHLNASVYKVISLDVAEKIKSRFDYLTFNKKPLDSHLLLVEILVESFLVNLLKIEMDNETRRLLDSLNLFERDNGSNNSISKLFALNFLKIIPEAIKDMFASSIKKRKQKFKMFAEHLYFKAKSKDKSLYNSLKHCEEEGSLTRDDVLGEFKMILFNANSMAGSLMWMLYAIAKNSDHASKISEDANYSKMAFMEVLRMFPPFHMLTYEQKTSSKCPMRFLPTKKVEFISVLGTHMSDINWSDPTKFNPERFSKGLSNIKKGSYIPFGGGERGCPGSGLAMVIGPVVMQFICGRYDVSLVKDPVIKRRVELSPEDGTIMFNLINK